MSETDDATTLEERIGDLETAYRGAGALEGKKPLTCAATDLRHALGMSSPAGSLNKEVCARVIALKEDGDLSRAGLIRAESTASDLRERLSLACELEEERPRSLGPVIYDLMAHVETAYDGESIAKLALANKTDDEANFEESYLEKRNAAAEDSDDE